MRKPKARITFMVEYELEYVEGQSPEQVLQDEVRDLIEAYKHDPSVKFAVIRKEVV